MLRAESEAEILRLFDEIGQKYFNTECHTNDTNQ